MKNDIFLILAMLGSMSYGVAQTPSESPLVTEAKKRQEKVRSLRCVYEMKEFFAEGSRTEQFGLTVNTAEPGSVSKESTPSKHYPEKDVIVDTRAEIIISGEMARFEETAPEYIVKEKTYKPSRTMYSDNLLVKKRRSFQYNQDPVEEIGDIDSSQTHYFNQKSLSPLMMCFRGMDPKFPNYQPKDFISTGSKLKIDNQECDEYQLKTTPKRFFRLWTSPLMAHSVVRIDQMTDNILRERKNIQYQWNAKTQRWIPQSWTIISYSKNGRLLTQTDATVKELEINEHEYSADEIDIQFPVGMRVWDYRNSQGFRVASDGSLVFIDQKEIMSGNPNPISDSAFFNRYGTLLLIAATAMIAASGFFYFRTRRR